MTGRLHSRARRRRLHGLFQANRRYGWWALNFAATSNPMRLPAAPGGKRDVIASCLQDATNLPWPYPFVLSEVSPVRWRGKAFGKKQLAVHRNCLASSRWLLTIT